MTRTKTLLALVLILTVALPAGAAEIPPTVDPGPCRDRECFTFFVVARDLDAGTVDPLWNAPYHLDTPYSDNAGWLAGDRVGYRCVYTLFQVAGDMIGRTTVRAIPGTEDYLVINDKFMDEGQRLYNGDPFDGQQVPRGECPEVEPGLYDQPGPFPDERPVIPFWLGDKVHEIRDYRTLTPGAGVTFRLFETITEPFEVCSTVSGCTTVNQRKTVLVYWNDVPVFVIYYDALGEGSLLGPADDGQPNPDDCNDVVSMSQGRQVYNGTQYGEPAASPLEASTGEQWMLEFKSGRTLPWFTVAANWNTLDERHRCGTNDEVDRVVLIFDPRESAGNSGSHMVANLDLVAGIVAARYPNAEFVPTMLVGANGHVTCTGKGFTASQTHAQRIDELEATAYTVGPDLDIPCTGYADPLGHLTPAGAAEANADLGAAFIEG